MEGPDKIKGFPGARAPGRIETTSTTDADHMLLDSPGLAPRGGLKQSPCQRSSLQTADSPGLAPRGGLKRVDGWFSAGFFLIPRGSRPGAD